MSTWAELRQKTFRLLDVVTTTTGDLKDAVDDALVAKFSELVVESKPRELFITSSTVTVDSSDTSIALGVGGLGVTDMWRPHRLVVDADADNDDQRPWDFISWEHWISANDPVTGDQRGDRSWTLTPDDEVILSQWPSDPSTWDVTLHYWSNPATLNDASTPELATIHHPLLPIGAATLFPHLFQSEERQALFTKLEREWNAGKNRVLMDRPSARGAVRVHQRTRRYTGFNKINWGN